MLILNRYTLSTTLLFIGCLSLFSNGYYFERITSKQGLSQNNVLDIFQDSEGFMWFSTLDGLNRYDGYDFQIFRSNKPNLSGNIAPLITEDNNKVLWIGTNRNSIDRFDLLSNKFIANDSLNGILQFTSQIEGIEHYDNVTYILTQDELVIINRNNVVPELKRYSDANVETVDLSMLSYIKLMNKSCLFILTKDHKIIQVNTNSNAETFSYYKEHGTHRAISLIPYKNGVITAGFSGVCYIDSRLNSRTISKISGREVIIDNFGFLWYASYSGLLKFQPSHETVPFKIEQRFLQGDEHSNIGSNTVLSLYKDNSGIIWIGLDGGGINKYNPNRKKFQYYKSNKVNGSIASNHITKIYEDQNHNIWFGRKNSGLSVLKKNNEKQFGDGFYNYNSELFDLGYIRDIGELMINGKQKLFIASSDRDFNEMFNPILAEQNSNTFSFQHYLQYAFTFEQDENHIWFGSYNGGLLRYSSGSLQYDLFHADTGNNSLGSNIILDILCDSKKRVWIATSDGLSVLTNVEKIKPYPKFTTFKFNPNDTTSLSENYILILFETNDHQIIAGTLGGGLNIYNEKLKSFRRINTSHGLPNNVVKGILEDESKNLWVSTNRGLSKIDISNFQISNYDIHDGLQDYEFEQSSCCKLHDGQMIFGGVSGFNVFNPKEIIADTTAPRIVFTDFQILNRSVKSGEKLQNRIILDTAINRIRKLKLHYSENSFTLFFTSLYHSNPSGVKYKYQLDGFDIEWQYTNPEYRLAKYTNLKPGDYKFRLNAANPDGYWNNQDRIIEITITPPIYRSVLAYIIYFIVIIATMALYRMYYRNRLRIENELNMERFEKTKIMQLSKAKLQFFTNISHDFRTPLSLIRLCFDAIKNQGLQKANTDIDNYIETGTRNINVLLRLINQLIDFRKMEQGKLSLRLEEFDIVILLKGIFDSFKIVAHKKTIRYRFKSNVTNLIVQLDSSKIENVFYNLLSNAFKYTMGGDEVTLEILLCGNEIKINIADSGIGIPDDLQEHIFERFYQVNKIDTANQDSSGIGLSLSKGIIEMHGGQISFQSKDGEGSCFNVTIPTHHNKNNEISDGEDLGIDELVDINTTNRNKYDDITETETGKDLETKKTILLIEDNQDLREIMMKGFSVDYKMLEAENGEHGYKICKEQYPDLVISDIMMPVKNGLELCELVKGNIHTSHIPVILLTAKTHDEHKIAGYQHGADAYINKPFNFEVLKMQVKALFDHTERLRKKLNDKPNIKPQALGVLPVDQKFIENIQNSIEKNMANSEFSIEDLASECFVSTSTLIRKFKNLLGTTPKAFIRLNRLKRAELLLRENKISILDIINEVGFVDYSHFAKNFKKEYGVTPRNYTR